MLTETLRERFLALDTPAVSDALDRLGLPGACHGLLPLTDGTRLCGTARTLAYQPVGLEGGTVGDYIDDMQTGEVVVIDNQGRLDCTVWGDLLTTTASRQGIAGTVIDGVCRDVGRSLELGYPIYSRGRGMRTGKDRVHLAKMGEPVSVAATRVDEGDVLIGDADGVVVVPSRRMGEVLEVAELISSAEDEIREAIAAGARLDEARAQIGYHGLQTRWVSDVS